MKTTPPSQTGTVAAPAGSADSGPVRDGASTADAPVWHTLTAEQALQAQGVEPLAGLSDTEVAARLARVGPNKLTSGKAEPKWRAFLRQYRDPMQIVLLIAG